MKYRNPQIPEGINTSERHPLREFALLLGGALVLIALLTWLLGTFGGHLARKLPFEYEAALVPDDMLGSDAQPELQTYLDDIAARVSGVMGLSDDIRVQLHFSGADTFNAFATLGGNVLLYRGLVSQLPHENALTMLIAHEIAHVAHRDPIVGIGRGVSIQLVFGLVLGNPNLAVLGNAGIYTQLHFNRDMERAADSAALAAVHALYGHVAGAGALFDTLRRERDANGMDEPLAVFNSHPLDAQRLQAIADLARDRGWSTQGEITPLPTAFVDWMRDAEARAEQGE